MPAVVYVNVRTAPRARGASLRRRSDGTLAARVGAPAVGGRANAAVLTLLAERLGVPVGSLAIARGRGSRAKRVAVTTNDPDALRAAIARLAAST